MKRINTTHRGGLFAIKIFIAYCVVVVLFSALLGAPLFGSEYGIEWLGVFFVLLLSAVLSEVYRKIDEDAPVKQDMYFALILIAVAVVICVIGVSMHVGSPASTDEVHGSETAIEFLLLQDVSPSALPPFTMVFVHTLMIFAIVAALAARKKSF